MTMLLRTFKWITFFAAAAAAGGFVAQGCGGDQGVASDAGPDVTKDEGIDQGVDTGADVPQDAGSDACENDADLNDIPIPDAAAVDAGADGGVNIGACLSCVKAQCQSQIQACNADCVCKDGLLDAIPCIQQNGLSLKCAGSLSTDTAAVDLGKCMLNHCAAACNATKFLDGGLDASNEAAADATSDSTSDGGAD